MANSIWERNPMSTDLYNYKTFLQKLEYIPARPAGRHAIMCRKDWRLTGTVEEYKFSSVSFYEAGKDEWEFQLIMKIN